MAGQKPALEPSLTDQSKFFKEDPIGATTGNLFGEAGSEDETAALKGGSSSMRRLSSTDLSFCAKKAATVIQEVALANSHSLVDRGILEEIIQDNKARFAGCVTMPLTFLFFALYIASATLHEDITNVHLISSLWRQTLQPPLEGLLTLEDVWHYTRGTLVDTLFRQEDMYNVPLTNSNEWSRVFTYNRLQGAIEFSQVRSIRERCDKELSNHMVCYPQAKYSLEPFGRNISQLVGIDMSKIIDPEEGFVLDSSDGRRLRVMREEINRYMPREKAGAEFKFYLYPSYTKADLYNHIDYLKQRGWLDDSSSRLTIKALVLNPEIEPPRLEHVQWIFAFSRGGGVFATMRFETLFLRAWNSEASKIIDVFFILMLIVQSTYCGYMITQAVRAKRCKQFFKRAVNFLALVNVSLTWLNVLGFLYQDTYRKDVIDLLDQMTALRSTNHTLAQERELSRELHTASDSYTSFSVWYRLFITYMNLLLMIRCFLVLEFQPRLAVVIATLKATSIDLAHFLIVFIPTFFAYAVAGMCIFGRRVDEFSSIERAIGTCFKIAMESEYEWDKLSEEDFLTSASWVWTFLLLIVLLMLNMVLAIIMDVYTEVRNAAGNSETVLENIRFILKRTWLWRDWISDDTLLQKLQEMPRAMTGREFREAFPTMTDTQYKRLMNTAVSKAQTAMRTGMHNSFLAHMTSAIKVGLDRAIKALSKIKKEQQVLKANKSVRTDATCIEDIMQSVAVQNHWMASVQTQLDNLRSQTRTKDEAKGMNDLGEMDDS